MATKKDAPSPVEKPRRVRRPKLSPCRRSLYAADRAGEAAARVRWEALDTEERERWREHIELGPGWLPEPLSDDYPHGLSWAERATFQAAFADAFLRSAERHGEKPRKAGKLVRR